LASFLLGERMARLWRELTTTDFATIVDLERTVALLPVAAIEQHGPHLPLGVDAIINEGIVRQAFGLMPDNVLVLPMMEIGKSNEHQAFPGTLTLGAETLTRLWTEIGESVHRAGIRKLVMVNSHGGQPQIMDIVARDLRVRLAMLVVACNLSSLGRIPGLFPAQEGEHGIHGGSSETSQILHLRPELVRRDRIRDFVPESIRVGEAYKFLRYEGSGIGFGWQTQDLNEDGACGNAADADGERGGRLVGLRASGLAELLEEVSRFPLAALRAGPLG
jgi:creatinine amidohydrolase